MVWVGAVMALVSFAALTASAQIPGVSIELRDGVFRVAGWKAPADPPKGGWQSVFTVSVGIATLFVPPPRPEPVPKGTGRVARLQGLAVPPMLGTYAVENGMLEFRPQFPLAPGVHYQAIFNPGGQKLVAAQFEGPRVPEMFSTHVEHVYPSADVLPSNDLKLYIYFSAPMSRGEAWQHIHLLDAAGKPLPRVFLELGQELWDPDYTRLTVLFDPGRIKRGVVSNETMGPPIVDGKHYTLVIDRDWKDAHGVPMIAGYRKAFRGGPEDRNAPDPQKWRVTAPGPSSSTALVVDFPKPMDYALLQRMITVAGPHGNIAGDIAVDQQETRWRFTPRQPWAAGDYRLVIDTQIEDLSGNKIGHPFDLDNIDQFERVTKRIDIKSVSLPFTIR